MTCIQQVLKQIQGTSLYYTGDCHWIETLFTMHLLGYITLKVWANSPSQVEFDFDTVPLYGTVQVSTQCTLLTKSLMLRSHQLEFSDESWFLG